MKVRKNEGDFLFFQMTPQERKECIHWAYRKIKRTPLRFRLWMALSAFLVFSYCALAVLAFLITLILGHPVTLAAGVGMLASAYIFAWLINAYTLSLKPTSQRFRCLSQK